jgi:hypothetical protein
MNMKIKQKICNIDRAHKLLILELMKWSKKTSIRMKIKSTQ